MTDQTGQALLGLIFLFMIGVAALVAYIAHCAMLWHLGRKFQNEGFLAYCIPVYQWVLMCRCAGVSAWHAAPLCVPMVNFGAKIWVFGNIARRMGRNFWGYGIGSLVYVPVLVLAFGNARLMEAPAAAVPVAPASEPIPAPQQTAPRYVLSCVQGEIVGTKIEIPAGSIVIGRNPQQAQVVLSHPHVSSQHARVWTESFAGAVRIWMEDLQSMNGTSIRRGTEQGWTPLKGGVGLQEGDMIRIADGIAEFRVVGV